MHGSPAYMQIWSTMCPPGMTGMLLTWQLLPLRHAMLIMQKSRQVASYRIWLAEQATMLSGILGYLEYNGMQ